MSLLKADATGHEHGIDAVRRCGAPGEPLFAVVPDAFAMSDSDANLDPCLSHFLHVPL